MTNLESQFTSTGAKLWRHPEAMQNYREHDPRTIISTHISPTSSCNLSCGFCSVAKRGKGNSIPMSVIQNYVLTLKRYGLKAVILTGGGEPLLYTHINELVGWLVYEQHLEVALITNGTACERLRPDRWGLFKWVRVSLNAESIERINLPTGIPDSCVIGASVVYVGAQENMAFLQKCAAVTTAMDLRYVRVLPDCTLYDWKLQQAHEEIDAELFRLSDPRFFHQHKEHGKVKAAVCHQSHFRPYLSEEPFHGNGKPGTVFPCDSVVLNNEAARFEERYQLCHANDVDAWLNGHAQPRFDPRTECTGCVFSGTVNMLDDWQRGTVDRFDDHREPIQHENFI